MSESYSDVAISAALLCAVPVSKEVDGGRGGGRGKESIFEKTFLNLAQHYLINITSFHRYCGAR